MLWMMKVKHQQYVCMLVDAAVHLAFIINLLSKFTYRIQSNGTMWQNLMKSCHSQSARIGKKEKRCRRNYDLSFTDVHIYQDIDCLSSNCIAQMWSDKSPIKSKESNHNYLLNLTLAHLMPQVF